MGARILPSGFPLSSICRKRAEGDKYTREGSKKEGFAGPKWNSTIFEKHRVCSAKARGGVGSGMELRVQRPDEVGGGTFNDWKRLAVPGKVRRIEE